MSGLIYWSLAPRDSGTLIYWFEKGEYQMAVTVGLSACILTTQKLIHFRRRSLLTPNIGTK